jgi:hypothetical protein
VDAPVPGQTFAQSPQFITSLMAVSQPLFGLPSQLSNPPEQLGEHVLAAHAFVPFTAWHVVPHAPQLFASVVKLLHDPPQHQPPVHEAPIEQLPPSVVEQSAPVLGVPAVFVPSVLPHAVFDRTR